MADRTLRAAERAWTESGTEQAEAAYLSALQRAGRLPDGRLRTAARYGYDAAATALGGRVRVQDVFTRHADPRDRFDVAAHHLAATLVARVALARWLRQTGDEDLVALAAKGIERVERWALTDGVGEAAPLLAEASRLAAATAGVESDPITRTGDWARRVPELLRWAARGEAPTPERASLERGVATAFWERLRAWCLGRDLPDTDPLAADAAARRTDRALGLMARELARAIEVRVLVRGGEVQDLPSHITPGVRVIPLLVVTEPGPVRGPFPGLIAGAKVQRLDPAVITHVLLPAWAGAGRRVAADPPLEHELDPLELQRRILALLSPEQAEAFREQAELERRFVARRAARQTRPRRERTTTRRR